MSEQKLLYTKSLCAGYGKKIVVNELSFELKQGQILTLIGPNGAGKSTVLKTITGQLSAISGNISLCGKSIDSLSEKDISKQLSILLTDKISTERMTCGDIVSTGRYPYTGRFGILDENDKKIVKDAMAMTDISELYDRDFSRISDGQRQCVMLARAIAQEPSVLLLDEPTSFLDIGRKLQILTVIRKLAAERGIAVIQSLHELDLAQKFSDTLICIKDKRADRIGPPEEIFKSDYISKLYDIKDGSYNALYGTAEPAAAKGDIKTFVIGGGGKGIPVYRRLQKQGIPFAAGILHENDVEYPAAKALSALVVTEKAFEPISAENIDRAKQVIKKCNTVICCLDAFGTMNKGNQALLSFAEEENTDISYQIPPNIL